MTAIPGCLRAIHALPWRTHASPRIRLNYLIFLIFSIKSVILTFMSDYVAETYSVSITRNPETGFLVEEKWHDGKGRLHRDGDLPAHVIYEETTGKPSLLRYHRHGDEHREQGPSTILFSAGTDRVIYEEWRTHGKHNDHGLASIARDADNGDIIEIQISKNGHLMELPLVRASSARDDFRPEP